ncbi:MAG: hypothetical protein A2784_02015 [Candidatus Chisholmbacteria bacterium RIFCSPHIGHO2_01_FULL_48_12]|uniref:BrnT family toxin n=1 Tax=Candidatus Chisholmbacteria bacterium RIFCSPHIGHO2_01_FULL_48_12 TaxID=1797589 RepID=A0A1G1VK16_9BACT|nr:MAG: hypothetical protein A2784_02015 [Candidatus Chisholmbacteria bacterium RIFCSPHIGHO2_01_FULL_48_12]
MVTFKQPIKFIWDKGNQDKNWLKHQVTTQEAEQVFFDPNKKIHPDKIHSQKEARFILLGKTKNNRLLFIILTTRNSNIRIISARDINKQERPLYETTT